MSQRSSSEIDAAIEVFVRAWCASRSRTHPYLAERVGSAWVMRDAPRSGKAPRYRREEWVAQASVAVETADVARQQARDRYAICIVRSMHEAGDSVRQEYRELGFRLGGLEALMVHPLARIPRTTTAYEITRVKTPELVDQLARTRGHRPRQDLLHPDAPIRQYVALADGDPVGWVESILVQDATGRGARTWCENMFVAPSDRRQGIGRALLSQMLRDDRQRGAQESVLLATHAGAELYPTVGYRQIGELMAFTPARRGADR